MAGFLPNSRTEFMWLAVPKVWTQESRLHLLSALMSQLLTVKPFQEELGGAAAPQNSSCTLVMIC